MNKKGDVLAVKIQHDGTSAFAFNCKSIKNCSASFAVFPDFKKNTFSYGFSFKHTCY